ncbi:hypothetical protein BLL52_0287 [Rhodoferax antarcticus ANT.BR]|uniref:Uncharacterized protein n=1 Tax=Rhodoferax antarcticus ANT.BR TaxID=1111071 RepID=A0A1Q8YL51_9BURK|nr:hypothetical protein BLL52_0287 [Rhodoferax antarcticus ANT.BR]
MNHPRSACGAPPSIRRHQPPGNASAAVFLTRVGPAVQNLDIYAN